MTHVLTLVAAREAGSLPASIIQQTRDIAGGGTVTTLSPNEAAEIACETPPDLDLILHALSGLPIDAISTPAEGRRKNLLIADMDSTIIANETLDELAAYAGLGEKIAAITRVR